MDARCPAVHCPPSLRNYLRSLRPHREIILVLTKADLVDSEALEGWYTWLKAWWIDGSVGDEQEHEPQVVSVSSYDTALLRSERRHRPHIPTHARIALLEALQIAHARLLSAPDISVRETVHWDDLDKDSAQVVDDTEATQLQSNDSDMSAEARQLEPLTIGLVGQPNVGKSSLLNALLGTTKVRASRTPGKTKHWQTILWGARREVRIVDCPGLVCPSVVPLELQAMSGSEFTLLLLTDFQFSRSRRSPLCRRVSSSRETSFPSRSSSVSLLPRRSWTRWPPRRRGVGRGLKLNQSPSRYAGQQAISWTDARWTADSVSCPRLKVVADNSDGQVCATGRQSSRRRHDACAGRGPREVVFLAAGI